MREIERIGIIMRSILNKLFGGRENFSVTFERQIEDTKGALLNEIDFDLDKFMRLNDEESNEYIAYFKELNIENVELLAKIISQIGFGASSGSSKEYLRKALRLYEYCNVQDKVYSFDREENMNKIQTALL
ncbi:MAG: hypothetical protein LBH92_01185 [Bacteroidales bacterium]|nr:hypothetical protein [Bacteroidales bacterium]